MEGGKNLKKMLTIVRCMGTLRHQPDEFWLTNVIWERSTEANRRREKNLPGRHAGIMFNEGSESQYFAVPAGKMTTAHLERIVESLRGSQVRVFILCVAGKKTIFPSRVWEPFWEGFDPNQGMDQPFMAGTNDPWFYRLAANLLALVSKGIDPVAHTLACARRAGMEAWVSIRMNDGHARGLPNHPLNSRFYSEHPQYLTTGNTLGPAWDYAQRPVQDHFMALIQEILERYDIDGLELDWLRSPNHFRDGEFARGRALLSGWVGEVREAVRAAAQKGRRLIVLCTRVPARPDVARGIGLDAVNWARRGLIDRLVVGPYKGTTDFDVPVEKWNRLLAGTGVPVTVSLEHVVSFYPGAPNCWGERWCMTGEQLRGAAAGALHRGSDGIYLFNQMERPFAQPELFRELGGLRTLRHKDRDHLQTWVNPEIPGKPLRHALPRIVPSGGAASFRLYTGPRPSRGAVVTLFVTLSGFDSAELERLRATVNSEPAVAQAAGPSPILPGDVRMPFLVAPNSLSEGYARIWITNGRSSPLKITGVELAMRFRKNPDLLKRT